MLMQKGSGVAGGDIFILFGCPFLLGGYILTRFWVSRGVYSYSGDLFSI